RTVGEPRQRRVRLDGLVRYGDTAVPFAGPVAVAIPVAVAVAVALTVAALGADQAEEAVLVRRRRHRQRGGAIALEIRVTGLGVGQELLVLRVHGPQGLVHEQLPDLARRRAPGHVAAAGLLDRQQLHLVLLDLLAADPDRCREL